MENVIHLCLNPGFELQVLTINFIGFGSHAGFIFHTSRQSFEPSYTQIQALLVFFFSIALSKKDSRFYPVPDYTQFKPTSTSPRSAVSILSPLFLLIASLKSWSAQGPLKWIVCKWQHSCDFKYQVIVLSILLLKNTTKKVCNCPYNYLGL